MRTWERRLLAAGRDVTPAQEAPLLPEKLKGWKAIAEFVGLSEANLRLAAKDIPELERCIYREGGRYWAVPGELMNVRAELLDRRFGASPERVWAASKQPRVGGRFSRARSV